MSLIKDGQRFEAAYMGNYQGDTHRYKLNTYDDGSGPLWILRFSHGEIGGIVRAKTFGDAYSICEDEFFPEADEKNFEAIAKEIAFDGDIEDIINDASFQEGYGFRPNGPNVRDKHNHGVYAHDLNGEDLRKLDQRLIDELHLTLEIEDEE